MRTFEVAEAEFAGFAEFESFSFAIGG